MKTAAWTVIGLAAAMGGCASGAKHASSGVPVNRMCPVMLEHDVPGSGAETVTWKGKTVGFCCADCIDAWNKMSDAEKDTALAAASK
jgi:hypothetical protein